jgi:hypothetical protein
MSTDTQPMSVAELAALKLDRRMRQALIGGTSSTPMGTLKRMAAKGLIDNFKSGIPGLMYLSVKGKRAKLAIEEA